MRLGFVSAPVDFQPADNTQEDKVQDSKASDTSSTSSHGNGDQKSHELSNLRLENQLLRNEVQSLNQEMATLIQRSKGTQEGNKNLIYTLPYLTRTAVL